MKYLFINGMAGTTSTGRLAAETCRSLMAQGHQCLLAYGRNLANCDDIPVLRIGSDMDNRINALGNRIFDNQGFGTRGPTRKFLEQVKEYDPDVIWLHNLHGYYIHVGLLFDYLRTCGKQIIWTLHDCWTFTGHCTNFDYVGCEKWKTRCFDCPQKKRYPASLLLDSSRSNYIRKRQAFCGIPNLSLQVPSHWLERLVNQSFLQAYPVQVVANTVNREVFHPTPGTFRQDHGLQDRKIVLGVASVWDRWKGLEDFAALSRMLPDTYQIVMVGLSKKQLEQMPSGILGIPRTENIQQLAQIYTAADVYVSASVEETFGMTVLEAASCGTYAIVYQGTASEEVVQKFGGRAVPRGVENLCAAILQKCEEK